MEGGSVGHNFERDPPKDHPCQVCFKLVQGFQRRRFKCESLRRTDGRTDDDGRPVMAKAHMAFRQMSYKGHTTICKIQKTKDRATRTPLKTGVTSGTLEG